MKRSVLQDWVMELPLMQQAVLCSALRGPDGFAKNDPVKIIVRYLRGVVLNPAHPDLVAEGRDDVFMNNILDNYYSIHYGTDTFPKVNFKVRSLEFLQNLDPYPIHFILHLAHAAEILGYKYPWDSNGKETAAVSHCWYWFYESICHAFHMQLESDTQLDERLNH